MNQVELVEFNSRDKEHIQVMYVVRTHPEVDRYLRGEPPKSYEEHEAYLSQLRSNKRFFLVQIENLFCGYCQWTVFDAHIEIGIALHPDHSSKGIGGRAIALLLGKLEQYFEYKNRELILFVKAENVRAQKLYRKHGFIEEGTENEYGEYLMKKKPAGGVDAEA